METCEHELFCNSKEWITDDEIKITMKCSLCSKNFKGVLKQNE